MLECSDRRAGTRIPHVAYKGTGQALQDLLAGNVQMAIDSVNAMLPHIRAGALRVLAMSTPERSPILPDLPTIADTLPGFEASAFNYITTRAGTPLGGTPEDVDARLKRESEKWKKVIEISGAKPE